MLHTFKLNKNGMEFNLIIGALIVLVIIIIVFFLINKNTNFLISNTGCETGGGKCVDSVTDCDGKISTASCKDAKKFCCIDV
jgi:hypothetical protein